MIPTVSVLMPVWRVDPRLLRTAIESLLAQTWEDFELVVVEARSDVPAGQLLRRMGDRRIHHHITVGRANMVDQLNEGLSVCRADLVARLDADDVCQPQRLEKQVAFLDAHREVAVLGTQISIIDDQGNELGRRSYPITHQAILRALPRFNPLAHPSVMFRRAVVVASGGYRGVELPEGAVPWCQDYELWSRLAIGGVRLANLRDTLLAYRLHANQVKAQNQRDSLRAFLQIKSQYWSSKMDWSARVRMQAERLLLLLPPRWVSRLFQRLTITSAGHGRQ